MQGGPPYRGNSQWGVSLSGVPEATFAMLYLGFSNTSYNGTPLPFRLGAVGLPETVLSIALDFGSTFRPVLGGRAVQPVPIPNLAAFSYVPTFYQWVILDPTAPGGFTLSQAGKTVLY